MTREMGGNVGAQNVIRVVRDAELTPNQLTMNRHKFSGKFVFIFTFIK